MEPNEVHEFSEQMKEAGESALTHIALGISILAALLALVTVLSHRSHTEAVLNQARASDMWNEYQAKKIRSETTSTAVDLLQLQPSANSAATAAKLADYKGHISKWNDDLAEEQKQAREFEHEVEVAERRAARYDLGEALLQISIVLSSITLLTRKQAYWIFGMVIGVVGLVFSALGLAIH